MDNIILIIKDNSVEEGEALVETIGRLGYRYRKINPYKLPKTIAKNYFPNEHPETEFAYKSIQRFLKSENAYYWYILKEIGKSDNTNLPTVSVLVNSCEYVEELKERYGDGVCYVKISDVWDDCDAIIDPNKDMDEEIEKIIRVFSNGKKELYKHTKENR